MSSPLLALEADLAESGLALMLWMATNPDFKDLFAALFDAQADFIVVGAHAVMVYTEPRYTKDLDVWVRPMPENSARKVIRNRRSTAERAGAYASPKVPAGL